MEGTEAVPLIFPVMGEEYLEFTVSSLAPSLIPQNWGSNTCPLVMGSSDTWSIPH